MLIDKNDDGNNKRLKYTIYTSLPTRFLTHTLLKHLEQKVIERKYVDNVVMPFCRCNQMALLQQLQSTEENTVVYTGTSYVGAECLTYLAIKLRIISRHDLRRQV